MFDKEIFAQQLKSILEQKGWSQRSLAIRVGTTEATISRYVSGDRIPGIDSAVALAETLGVSLDKLVGVNIGGVRQPSRDVIALVRCYRSANPEQRSAIWAILNSFGLLSAHEKAVIDAILAEKKSEASAQQQTAK